MIKTKSFELAEHQKGGLDLPKLALVLPGKLDTKDYPHMRSHVEYLANKGFLAVSFDPPGTWQSPGHISLYTMTNYLKAINEVVEYFGNRPTFVMGHSLGGSLGMEAASSNQSIVGFAGVMSRISFEPADDNRFPDDEWKNSGIKVERRKIPNTDPVKYREFPIPYSFLEDRITYNMLEGLKLCRKPKLFFTGKQDEIVPPEMIQKAFEVSPEPKELHELDSRHNYLFSPPIIDEVNAVVGNFLEKYLP